MPRALLLLLPLLAAHIVTPAEVFVIADTNNQTLAIAENAKETIAEANNNTFADDTLTDSDDNHEPIVRKKRTFGDVVFRGLADVLGYSVARKPPQIQFPPPLAPVPGIDEPLQVALIPVVAAGPAPAPAPAAPAPCGTPRAAPPPCRAQAPPPPPPPKPTQPPCPRPRANPRPKPRPTQRPRTTPPPPPPPPCARPRANPTTPSPCAPPPRPSPPPKADSNLETITSNFRLDFNFNRAPAASATAAAEAIAEEDQPVEQEQEQIIPVAIQPRAAKLPQEPPRTPRVYLDAFVVRNGVPQKVHAVDARNLNQPQPQADEDYLAYDEQERPQQNDDYEYADESQDRAKAVQEFSNAVNQFWEQKQKKPKKKIPVNDYRNVHFGDRELANELRRRSDAQSQTLQNDRPNVNRIPKPLPETDEEDEITTTTQDPRRRLKPRVLPPTEKNPNEIDTITVRVPPIYKEKRPKKLHREQPERPDRDEDSEEISDPEEQEYLSDSETENTDDVPQTEKPKRKRRKKQNENLVKRRRIRSAQSESYTAGDYDYYGNKLPISDEEEYFLGLTIPPPTKDADVIRLEESNEEKDHFLDDHERLTDDPERIKYHRRNEKEEQVDESERSDENERSEEDKERAGDNERADETERTDKLSPNARVRETGFQSNYVHATNVQVDDPRPHISTVKKKTNKIGKV